MRTKTTRIGNGVGLGGRANGPGCPVSAGHGWGGPARGASRSRRAALYEPGNRAAVGHNGPDWERLAAEHERTERILDALFDLAMGAPDANVQIAAAVAFMNRVEGPCRTMTEVAAERDAAPQPSGIRVRFADE